MHAHTHSEREERLDLLVKPKAQAKRHLQRQTHHTNRAAHKPIHIHKYFD